VKYIHNIPDRRALLLACACECLQRGSRRLRVALSQRRSFEGWFKVELAAEFSDKGVEVSLEQRVTAVGATRIADLQLRWEDQDWVELIFIKTVATPWSIASLQSDHDSSLGTAASNQYKEIRKEIEWSNALDMLIWEIVTVFPTGVENEGALVKRLQRSRDARAILQRPDYQVRLLPGGPSGDKMGVLVLGPFGQGVEL
jgi:hypothetical protein